MFMCVYGMYVYMYLCVYICIYVCIILIYMDARVFVLTYAWTHVCETSLENHLDIKRQEKQENRRNVTRPSHDLVRHAINDLSTTLRPAARGGASRAKDRGKARAKSGLKTRHYKRAAN